MKIRRSFLACIFSFVQSVPLNNQTVLAEFPPADFFFGLATAPAHAEDKLHDSWLDFAHKGGVAAWKNVGLPEERLRAWTDPEVDIRLAAEAGIQVYRMGVDWGRLSPRCQLEAEEPCGVQDAAALARYAEILRLVRSYNMSVMLSLFHHSFPTWGLPRGATYAGPSGAADGYMWQHPNAIKHFVAFSTDVVQALDPLVDYWVTINEPVVYVGLSYCTGIWPPGPKVTDQLAQLNCMTNPKIGALRAQMNMVAAHKQVYSMIHAHESSIGRARHAPVGIAHLVMFSEASRPVLDSQSKLFLDSYSKYFFVDLVKSHIDFCGLNYYGKEVVEGMAAGFKADQIEYSGSGRGIFPSGLFALIADFHARYKDDPQARFMQPGGIGYVITENGVADATDILRPSYIIEHLLALSALRTRGIPVAGYVHWTLTDNWEWADGYCPKFGLVSVDRSEPALPRTPRNSYYLFQRLCRSRTVTQGERDLAWGQVTDAAARGVNHSMCRDADGVSSLDVPRPFRVIGGSADPDGGIVDWRFRELDRVPGTDLAQASTTMLLRGISFSETTGIDFFAGTVSTLAGLSNTFFGEYTPPSPPTPPLRLAPPLLPPAPESKYTYSYDETASTAAAESDVSASEMQSVTGVEPRKVSPTELRAAAGALSRTVATLQTALANKSLTGRISYSIQREQSNVSHGKVDSVHVHVDAIGFDAFSDRLQSDARAAESTRGGAHALLNALAAAGACTGIVAAMGVLLWRRRWWQQESHDQAFSML